MRKEGCVKKILFHRDGWYVFLLTSGEKCTGHLPPMASEGSFITMEGNHIKSKFGKQFKASKIEMSDIEGVKAVIMQMPGYGPKKAAQVVSEYGSDAFGAVEKTLNEDGKKKLQSLMQEYQAMARLYSLGLTPLKVRTIYDYFKHELNNVLDNEPYRLIEIPGFGFKTADQVALRSGVEPGSEQRISACLDYIINDAQGTGGHCWLYVTQLQRLIYQTLIDGCKALKMASNGISQDKIKKTINSHCELKISDGKAWIRHLVNAEMDIYRKLTGEKKENVRPVPEASC